MSTRSLRNRVSSRQPSPANGTEAEAPHLAEDGDAGRNDDQDPDVWVEPVVRKLPPSYQDHRGLERVGVLELQQPLGEPPSSKLLQRLKLTLPRASPRPSHLQNDEVVTPSVESERQDLGSPMEVERLSEPTQPEPTQPDPAAITSPPRGRPAKRDVDEMRHQVPAPEVTPSPVQSTFSGTPQFPQKPASIQEHLRQDRVTSYVERAIQEAELKGDAGLVPGLRRIREDAFNKRELWAVLDAIAHQNPDEEQLSIFKRFIKKGVKRHRRNTLTPSNAGVESRQSFHTASPQPASASTGDVYPPLPSDSALNPSDTFTSPFRPRPSSSHLHPDRPTHNSTSKSPSSRRRKMASNSDRSSGQQKSTDSPRRRRSRSNSSSSSLSSAKSIPEHFAPQTDHDPEGIMTDEGPLKNGQPRQAHDPPQTGNRLRSSASAQPSSTHPFAAFNDVSKYAVKKLKKTREDLDYDAAEVETKRKHFLAASYQDYNYVDRPEINERHNIPYLDEAYPSAGVEVYIPPPVVHPNPVQPATTLRDGAEDEAMPDQGLQNGNARKRRFEEIDEDDVNVPTPLSSSPIPPYAPPPPPGVFASRAGTPGISKIPAVTKARKSARVMVSPNKAKNGGITAGISRAGASRDAGIGNGADSGAEDNDEFCASCGGEGILLCCDGCTRSMHHACLEPPLDPDDDVDGEWYCPQCMARRNKNPTQTPGFLGKVIGKVEDIIPKAFTLPVGVREYFDGVRTGASGEYEEYGQPTTQQAPKMNRAGFLEEPNYKEPRDNKGKLITCYSCGLSTNGRDIIPCSYCPTHWHLDCCDPPLAVPPRRRAGDKTANWRCPLHLEQDLAGLGRQAEAAPGDLGRRPKLRKPKNAKLLDVDLPRGFRNNGIIEVELMKDDAPPIKTVTMNGQVFRLPEKGIRLDFIDRVKRGWYEDQQHEQLSGRPQKLKEKLYRSDGAAVYHKPQHFTFTRKEPDFYTGSQAIAVTETAKANAALRHKTFAEQQAIIGLANMPGKQPSYTGDALADLTNQLIIDAPSAAEEAIQRSEKDQLLRLQELVARRLRMLDGVELPVPLKPLAPRPPPVLAPKPPNAVTTPYIPIAPNCYPAPSPPMRQLSYGNGTSMDGQHNPYSQDPYPQQRPMTQPQMQSQAQQAAPQQQQQQQDPAIDPRLFNGDFGVGMGSDIGLEGEVEMDVSESP